MMTGVVVALLLFALPSLAQEKPESEEQPGNVTEVAKTQRAEDLLNVFNVKTAFAVLYSFEPIVGYRLDANRKVVEEDGVAADRLAFATTISFSLTLAGNRAWGWDVFYPTFIQTVDAKIESKVAPLGIGSGFNWRLGGRSTAVSVNVGVFKTNRDVLTEEAKRARGSDTPLPADEKLVRPVGSLVGFVSFGVMP